MISIVRQAHHIFQHLTAESGDEYLSKTHRLIKDRKSLFISTIDSQLTPIRRYQNLPNQILFNAFKIQLDVAPIEKIEYQKK